MRLRSRCRGAASSKARPRLSFEANSGMSIAGPAAGRRIEADMKRFRRQSEDMRAKMKNAGFLLLVFVMIGGTGIRPDHPQESPYSICIECHDTMAEPFEKNLHAGARAENPAAKVCEACHGDATAHLEAGGGGGNIFAFLPEDGPHDVLSKCRTCHSAEDDLFSSSRHREKEKSCLACHLIHSEEPSPGLIRETRRKLCSACHDYGESHITEMNAIVQIEGEPLICLTCHNPHSQKIRINDQSESGGRLR